MQITPIERAAFSDTLEHFDRPKDQKKLRKCLKCGKKFWSDHYGHRKCGQCNHSGPMGMQRMRFKGSI